MTEPTKAQGAGCCLLLIPPLWPLLIIVSPILWLIHKGEKGVAIRKIKRDQEKHLEKLKKAEEERLRLAKVRAEEEEKLAEDARMEKIRNPYFPYKTKNEYLFNKKENLRIKEKEKEKRKRYLEKEEEGKKQEQEEALARNEEELRKKEKIKYLADAFRQRSRTKDSRSKLEKVDDLFNLSPIEFEKWVKTQIFETNGWLVEETRATGDGGIDLIITKKDERSIVQCKRFRGTVGEPMLRDFYGTMMHEGVSRGFFITTGLYSLSALKFSEDKPIEMIDRRILAIKYI